MKKSLVRDGGRGLRCSRGFITSPNGSRQQKFFALGTDASRAEKIAQALKIMWESETTVDASGLKVWSQKSIDAAYRFGEDAAPETDAKPALPTPKIVKKAAPVFVDPPVVKKAFLTINDALGEYAEQVKDFLVADATKGRKEDHIASLKYLFGVSKMNDGRVIGDIPVKDADNGVLARIKSVITARPLSRRLAKEGEERKKISLYTVKTWLMHCGIAFAWFKQQPKRIGWAPETPEWRENFALTETEVANIPLTEEEMNKADAPPVTFTLDEMVKIYEHGTDLHRIYMLMGLTLGWTQSDIGTLLHCPKLS